MLLVALKYLISVVDVSQIHDCFSAGLPLLVTWKAAPHADLQLTIYKISVAIP